MLKNTEKLLEVVGDKHFSKNLLQNFGLKLIYGQKRIIIVLGIGHMNHTLTSLSNYNILSEDSIIINFIL